MNEDKIIYMIFRLKDKVVIHIKVKKRLNEFNSYAYYIEVLNQFIATFENTNN